MVDEVIEFWFGLEPRLWFTEDKDLDRQIRERFGALHAELAAGVPAKWRASARSSLAAIIVLDQFSRNLYRDDARAFAQDTVALELAWELLTSGKIRDLDPQEQQFALMPFMHAEDVDAQTQSVAAFEQLAEEHPSQGTKSGLDFAKKHAAIIERFGRFPHRNAVLGRDSTPEEKQFLAESGRGF